MATGDKRVISPYSTNGVIETDKNVIDGDVYVKGELREGYPPYLRFVEGVGSGNRYLLGASSTRALYTDHTCSSVSVITPTGEVLHIIDIAFADVESVSGAIINDSVFVVSDGDFDSDNGGFDVYVNGIKYVSVQPSAVVEDDHFGKRVTFDPTTGYLFVLSDSKVYRFSIDSDGNVSDEVNTDGIGGDAIGLLQFADSLVIVYKGTDITYMGSDLSDSTDVTVGDIGSYGSYAMMQGYLYTFSESNIYQVSPDFSVIEMTSDKITLDNNLVTSVLPGSIHPDCEHVISRGRYYARFGIVQVTPTGDVQVLVRDSLFTDNSKYTALKYSMGGVTTPSGTIFLQSSHSSMYVPLLAIPSRV